MTINDNRTSTAMQENTTNSIAEYEEEVEPSFEEQWNQKWADIGKGIACGAGFLGLFALALGAVATVNTTWTTASQVEKLSTAMYGVHELVRDQQFTEGEVAALMMRVKQLETVACEGGPCPVSTPTAGTGLHILGSNGMYWQAR